MYLPTLTLLISVGENGNHRVPYQVNALNSGVPVNSFVPLEMSWTLRDSNSNGLNRGIPLLSTLIPSSGTNMRSRGTAMFRWPGKMRYDGCRLIGFRNTLYKSNSMRPKTLMVERLCSSCPISANYGQGPRIVAFHLGCLVGCWCWWGVGKCGGGMHALVSKLAALSFPSLSGTPSLFPGCGMRFRLP